MMRVGNFFSLPSRKRAASDVRTVTNLQELMDLQSSVGAVQARNSRNSQFHRLGNQRSNTRGHGIEFSDVRAYGSGDDTRHIDWRLTARCSTAMTRLYSEERDQPGYILLDQRRQMYFGAQSVFKSVVAARLAALLAWQCHTMNKQLGGLILGASLQKIKINHSRLAMVTWFNNIVRANQYLSVAHAATPSSSEAAASSLAIALRQCAVNTPAGANISVISDFHDFDNATHARLAALTRYRSVNLFKISDPVETDLELSGLVGISDGLQQQTVRLSAAQSQQYRDARAARDAHLKQLTAQLRCQLIEVSTEEHQQLAHIANLAN